MILRVRKGPPYHHLEDLPYHDRSTVDSLPTVPSWLPYSTFRDIRAYFYVLCSQLRVQQLACLEL